MKNYNNVTKLLLKCNNNDTYKSMQNWHAKYATARDFVRDFNLLFIGAIVPF